MFAQRAARLRAGEAVECRPTVHSMRPIIKSRQLVTIVPVESSALRKGDVVLAKVGGRYLLHKVGALRGDRVQISNDRGHVNGWTGGDQVYGIVAAVDGVPLNPRREQRPNAG